MNREQIERAERTAERLRRHDEAMSKLRGSERAIIAANDAKGWDRPKSLATPKRDFQFTEEQLLIAARALAKGNK
jgi:hypothetical protein